MTLDLEFLTKAVSIGLAVGVLAGSFGIGGGILCTPLMRLILHTNPHVAIGTSLALIVPTSIAGAISYLRRDLVAPRLARNVAVPAVAGTILGSLATLVVHGSILMLLISGLMAITGLDFITGFLKRLRTVTPPEDGEANELLRKFSVTSLFVGLICGFISGLLGVGGGFILIPCFMYLFHVSIKAAFGTSLLVVALVSVPGAIVHGMAGQVDLGLALPIIIGSVPGAWLGSAVSFRLNDAFLKMLFGLLLVGLAAGFGWRELGHLAVPHA